MLCWYTQPCTWIPSIAKSFCTPNALLSWLLFWTGVLSWALEKQERMLMCARILCRLGLEAYLAASMKERDLEHQHRIPRPPRLSICTPTDYTNSTVWWFPIQTFVCCVYKYHPCSLPQSTAHCTVFFNHKPCFTVVSCTVYSRKLDVSHLKMCVLLTGISVSAKTPTISLNIRNIFIASKRYVHSDVSPQIT